MAVARASGAVVRAESLQGKGHVVRRMFADIDADVYLLVDGDDTYDAKIAPSMMQLLLDRRLDMVSAARDTARADRLPAGSQIGQRDSDRHGSPGIRQRHQRYAVRLPRVQPPFRQVVSRPDMRIRDRNGIHGPRFGAEHAGGGNPRALSQPSGGIAVQTQYFRRRITILREIVTLIEHERPLPFFAFIMAICLSIALALGLPVIITFFHTGLVDRLPTAVLSASFVLLAALSLGCGFILDVHHARPQGTEAARLSRDPTRTGLLI